MNTKRIVLSDDVETRRQDKIPPAFPFVIARRTDIGYRETACNQVWDETILHANGGTKYDLTTDGLIDQVSGLRRINLRQEKISDIVEGNRRFPDAITETAN